MVRRTVRIGLLIWIACLLAGCWDATDVDRLDVVLVAGYDVPLPGQHGSIATTGIFAPVEESEEKVETLAADTIGETRSRRAYNASRQFSLVQLQAIVLGHDLALRGARDAVDATLRAPDVKNTVYLAVAEENAGHFMSRLHKKERSKASQRIIRMLQTVSDRAFVPQATLHDLALGSKTRGKTTVMPTLGYTDTDNNVEITGTALFEKDRMVARFDREETRALVLLRGLPAQGWIPFFLYDRGQMADQGTVYVSNQRQVKVTRRGDDFLFDIKVILTGRVVEHADIEISPFIDNRKHLQEVERAVARDMKLQMQAFVMLMQEELGVDAIDIMPYALAKWRQELTPVAEEGFIENVTINIEVEVNLQNVGEIG